MYGLSLAQARHAMHLGWCEPELRVLSAYLRAKRIEVAAVLGQLVAVRFGGHRFALYQGTALDDYEALLAGGALDSAAEPPPLVVFTDGSGTYDRTKPAGAGVVIYEGDRVVAELSVHAGNGTNNHAELSAVAAALRAIPLLDRAVTIWADSMYAIEACTAPGYEPRANAELMRLLRADVELRPRLAFRHHRGHQRVTPETSPEEAFVIRGNARADELAGAARRGALGLPPKPQPKPREAKPPQPRPIGKMRRARMPPRLAR